MAIGGARRPLTGSTYTLVIDGVPRETKTRSADTVTWTVDVSSMSEGYHWLDVQCDDGSTPQQHAVYVQHGPEAAPHATMAVTVDDAQLQYPMVFSSWPTWAVPIEDRWLQHYANVPARWAPTTVPLKPREYPPLPVIDTLTTPMACTWVVPLRAMDIHRTTVTKDGISNTCGSQAYFYSDFIAKQPPWHLLDGPRGQGTVAAATHLQIGRNGKIYGTDPWRFFKIAVDGTITTLAGWRSKTPPRYWSDGPLADDFELVGDWSAVPPERRGLHECWGHAWDERTLGIADGAPPPPGETESPHVTGPVAFLADTQNNRILRVEFSPVTHTVPGKVTEFIVGLADPWDVQCRAGVLYVSERAANRISRFDATTGAAMTPLIQGGVVGYVDLARRGAVLTVPLATAQQQPCALPEGLAIMDDWLYFGSRALEQVRRINLTTGQLDTLRWPAYADGNTVFFKIAVSDGTFMPKGTIFVSNWSSGRYGWPRTMKAEPGSTWDNTEAHFLPRNPVGGPMGEAGYSTAVAVGQGRLVASAIQEGVYMLSAAQPGDAVLTDAVRRGGLLYWQRGYRLTHGEHGWGHYGLPLPWGEHADIDAFLAFCGHTKPGA